jgi:ribonuclease P protein component
MVLAAAQRLRRREDFAATIRHGRRAGRGAVVVHLSVVQRTDEAQTAAVVSLPTRAGFVVAKSVGTAVTRNKVRRRLRHLIRDRLPALPAGAAVVVRALPASAVRTSADLGTDLDAALAAALGRGRTGSRVRPASRSADLRTAEVPR